MRLDRMVMCLRTNIPQIIHIAVVLIIAEFLPCTSSGENPLSKTVHMSIPPSHTALSGDLHVHITAARVPAGVVLQVSRLDGTTAHVLYTVPTLTDARAQANITIMKIPCGLFSRGGEYYVELIRNHSNDSDIIDDEEDKVSRGLDVRWPMPRLSLTPEHVQTYPESPVTAILEFPEVMCPPVSDNAPSAIPEFWLELHYCGHSLLTCDNSNQSHVQILYSEQIRGFPGKRMLTLRCELFGLAGHYALVLRPTTPMPSLSNTAAYVKADWSEQFVFNVHASNIMPCDPHSTGITVLFQYPSCILASGDRVRLYARLRADVASLAPPTSMEYVAEQKVTRGQHSLHFECDLFTERYVEYCFVYVSQAITGAVADVRMDCVPTMPVSESESGGWGVWSPWTPCSTTCAGGTRNRYRFCDSPPPRYGAKFCQGPAVETEKCGPNGVDTDWECIYGNGISTGDISPADRPEILAEVGPGCRCGCVIHLGQAKPRRLLATSSQSCPGRTFWLIQADPDHAIRFKVDHFRLPCGSQWLKVRDGNSLSATLLSQLAGTLDTAPSAVQSTGPYLLLEFFSDELMAGGEACGGGFLAHAQQIKLHEANNTLTMTAAGAAVPVAQGVGLVAAVPSAAMRLTAVHIAALVFVSVVLVATALLGAQYVLRYRKYHIAEDMDSLADPAESNVSIALRTRATSSATLLSEVISLTRLRPPGRNKHTRLRESMDCETEHDAEDECNNDSGVVQAEDGSFSSTLTLTPQESLTPPAVPVTVSEVGTEEVTCSAPISPGVSECSGNGEQETTPSPPAEAPPMNLPRPRRFSNVTLTNVRIQLRARSDPGCYSPAASIISTATIRSTNPKESKEKRNRERLLAGPGSEFSLAGPEADLELDYYDYNVVNAGAVPGSYLGMDPQYLVWIPPLDESGEILQNLEKVPFEYEDIRPKQFVDPGSNQESPEEEILIPKPRRRSISEGNSKRSTLVLSTKIHPLILDVSDGNDLKVGKELSPILKRLDPSKCSIPLHEFPKRLGLNSPAKVHRPSEKETRVEKSPSVKSYDDIDDIKFADDECDDANMDNGNGANRQCKKTPYQDSNILTSNKS